MESEVKFTLDTLTALALPCAICCHVLSKTHYGVVKTWLTNKWFSAGFFGNIPALLAFSTHLVISKQSKSNSSPKVGP